MEEQLKYKLVLLGNSSVGKTCIARRFARNEFIDGYQLTVGASFYMKQMVRDDGKTIQLDIWDTAGQQRYRSLTPMYYKGASAALIVYDSTTPSTFQSAKSWIKELHTYAPASIIVALCANKADLPSAVPTERGQALADQYSLIFSQVSAKTASNINQTFQAILRRLPRHPPKASSQKIRREDPEETGSSCC